jgi:hypothetical protein
VQLDADWNEQTAILQHYLRALAADIIGPHGGPGGGFTISALATGSPAQPVANDFLIEPGHYSVDGILCEADSRTVPVTGFSDQDPKALKLLYWPQDDLEFRAGDYVEVSDGANGVKTVQSIIKSLDPAGRALTLDTDVKVFNSEKVKPRVRRLITFLTQPDYRIPDADKRQLSKGDYLVYLDVWERLITYVEDDAIREVALGGPDTAARSKIVWQVKIADAGSNCDTDLNELLQPETRGWLKATAKKDATSTDPCIVSPGASYRGAENQLYRVEIHRHGIAWSGTDDPATTKAATFKWSRENGSVVYPIVSLGVDGTGATTTAVLENLGRDDRFGLVEGDWVEIVDDDYVLLNRAENLLQVQLIDRANMKVTLNGVPKNVGQSAGKHPLLRRWDHEPVDTDEIGLQSGSDNAALIIEGSGANNWLELEAGIKIQFQASDSVSFQNKYRTGDYWLIPARTATGDVEWPRTEVSPGKMEPTAIPPDGVTHHYAPLAVITVGANGAVTIDPKCRRTFPPLPAQSA